MIYVTKTTFPDMVYIVSAAVLYIGGWAYFTNMLFNVVEKAVQDGDDELPVGIKMGLRKSPIMVWSVAIIMSFFLWPGIAAKKAYVEYKRWRQPTAIKVLYEVVNEDDQ